LKETSNYQFVTLKSKTTVEETIQLALEKFNLKDSNQDNFSLIQVLLYHGINERTLNNDECPLQLLQQLRKVKTRENIIN
jgi:hypothetical protein